jgi:hypothetical protein
MERTAMRRAAASRSAGVQHADADFCGIGGVGYFCDLENADATLACAEGEGGGQYACTERCREGGYCGH